MTSLDQYEVPQSASFHTTQLIISRTKTSHHFQKSPLPQCPLALYTIYWHTSRNGMIHKSHKKLVQQQNSAVKSRHAKIVMLILTHLLSVFVLQMASIENLTKRDCSQIMYRMSLYITQISLQNLIFRSRHHHYHHKNFPYHFITFVTFWLKYIFGLFDLLL